MAASVNLSDIIKGVVADIAKEANFEHFEICVNEQLFTGDNYLGEIKRIKIQPTTTNGLKPINLVLKSATLDTGARDTIPVIPFYHNEVFVYSNIIPMIKKLQEEHNIPLGERPVFAKFYKGLLNEFQEMLIMKDLADDGFVLRDKKMALDYEHLLSVLQNLARIHAASFVLKEKDLSFFNKYTEKLPRVANFGEAYPSVMPDMAKKIEDLIKNPETRSKYKSFRTNIPQDLKDCLDASLTDPYNVICHGDSWNNNILFKYEDDKVKEVVLIDWQLSRIASPVTDVFYLFSMSGDPAVLSTHFNDLLDNYYDTLSKTIIKMGCDPDTCYPREVFHQHVEKINKFGLIVSICGVPITTHTPEEAKDVTKMAKELETGTMDIYINDLAEKRLNDLIEVFAKYGFI